VNNRAVQLAQAGLWQEAETTINQALALDNQEPIVGWNARLITLHAETLRADLALSGYPLLSHIFYGDYAAALALLRPYPPAQLFSSQSPLIIGTMAEDYQADLANWITRSTELALNTCWNCAFADYNPIGSGSFGGLACFRNIKEAYRKVQNKRDLMNLWEKRTEYVQEIYLCPEFEKRQPGVGGLYVG
jgi:hypothetical protein